MNLLWKFSLAATLPAGYDLSTLPFPLYASPKLDGVRAGVQNSVLVSRNGRPIANLQAQRLFGRVNYEGLDGELTTGPANAPDVFNRTVRVTQKRDADARDLRFNVFDRMVTFDETEQGIPFALRYTWLLGKQLDNHRGALPRPRSFAGLERSGVHLVPQILVRNTAQLLAFKARCLRQGYEGTMLRRADAGPYMQKRSTLREFDLVKLKDFDYGEARILAIHPLRHNLTNGKTATGHRSTAKSGITIYAHLIGSATVQDTKTGVEFDISIAGDKLRAWPGWAQPKRWERKVIRYKFFPTGNVDKPRFPTATFEELL